MKDQSAMYLDFDEYLLEQEKKLNLIYKDLVKNNQDKNAIKKFDRIVKANIDYKGLLPCSKSFEGESLLTLSKTWMILILLKITKGKAQQEQFITLVNSSLTHELNEYDEYKEFYEDQCEILFSEEEAIKQINLHPKLPKKINNNIDHDELRGYYIYLLFKPKYFQKVDLEGLSKNKKVEKKSDKNKKNLKSNNTSSIILNSGTDSEEDDEKADRLNEKDMISKNRAKQPSYKVGAKNKKNSISNKTQKNKKETTIEDDEDYETINDIINKKGKSGNKKEEAKKGNKKQNKKSSAKQKTINLDDEISDDEDFDDTKMDIDMDKSKDNKKNKKNKKISINDKKNKNNKKTNKKFEEKEESD